MKKLRLSMAAVMAIGSFAYADGDKVDVEMELESATEMAPVAISVYNTTSFKVGTLGLGLDLSIPMTEELNIRLSINGFSYSKDGTEEDLDYDGTAQLLTVGALADYYPYEESTFRLTAGVYYNGNETEAEAIPTSGTYEINNVTYQADEIGALDGVVDFDGFAPYLGLGWGGRSVEPGWGFTFDIGAMYHGEPNVSMEATRGPGIPNDEAGDAYFAELESNVEAERQTIENDLAEFKFYPVIMIGATYTF